MSETRALAPSRDLSPGGWSVRFSAKGPSFDLVGTSRLRPVRKYEKAGPPGAAGRRGAGAALQLDCGASPLELGFASGLLGGFASALRYISRFRCKWNKNLRICTAKLVCTSKTGFRAGTRASTSAPTARRTAGRSPVPIAGRPDRRSGCRSPRSPVRLPVARSPVRSPVPRVTSARLWRRRPRAGPWPSRRPPC